MIKISDFLGKPLISISDAKSVGYVSNVWFDGKLQYAKTAEITNDDDDDYPERAYVELRYMQCDGDAAVIKTTAHISASKAGKRSDTFETLQSRDETCSRLYATKRLSRRKSCSLSAKIFVFSTTQVRL